ncbi:hypothetical protein BKA65DRAFT_486151 [Rhexocercosporidium sp. MPI-PUGE-AT-0058]|nr:hypothetical protein BKA65DRAFT_486151 [Rhexocercosporidium sp. MPI-PUGE-AT-0058]
MKLITFANTLALLASTIYLLATQVAMALPSPETHLLQRVNHTGTIEEVFPQLEAEHPGFTQSVASISARPDDKSYDKRAEGVVIGQGIKYLRDLHLTCWLNPHSCGRVSRSYNAAIYTCNNNGIKLGPDCSVIANYAQALRNKCSFIDGFYDSTCEGQAWDINNWNVNVYKDKC